MADNWHGWNEQDYTLEVFRVGCEKKNYKILAALPTSVEAIMKEHGLTKMPANRRVNQLVAAGLATREYGSGKVSATPLANRFLSVMQALSSEVSEAVEKQSPLLVHAKGGQSSGLRDFA